MTPGESKLHFFVFPQALTLNGFTGAVMGATIQKRSNVKPTINKKSDHQVALLLMSLAEFF